MTDNVEIRFLRNADDKNFGTGPLAEDVLVNILWTNWLEL